MSTTAQSYRGETSFLESLVLQARVVHALMMREVITRYGRHNIGFFWLFCEPGMFCVGVICIKVFLHESTGRYLPAAAFAMTGYSTVLLWRNCGNKCSLAITPNLSLLYHRNVRVLDVILSRVILEISGCCMSFTLMMLVMCFWGVINPPENVAVMIAGYAMTAWFAFSLAIFVCAATELSEVFDRFWHPLTYFMLPICGLGYMVDWLPLRYQWLAMTVPMVNGVEMLRDGYFGKAVRTHYSAPYLACWNLALMFVGLTLLKVYARRAEPQ